MFDCNKCIQKCKASCCGIIPFTNRFIIKNKPVRKILKEIDFGYNLTILETENNYCPYLSEKFICVIYQKRPKVCRLYGSEKEVNLTCLYQDKNGRIRSRQERRAKEREAAKLIDSLKKSIN